MKDLVAAKPKDLVSKKLLACFQAGQTAVKNGKVVLGLDFFLTEITDPTNQAKKGEVRVDWGKSIASKFGKKGVIPPAYVAKYIMALQQAGAA